MLDSNRPKSEPVRWEDAAVQETRIITGWVCTVCGRLWELESQARYCHGRSNRPCRTKTCPNRVDSPYAMCRACREEEATKTWEAMPRVEWDGVTPLCVYEGDQFFFDAESVQDYVSTMMHDHGWTLDQIRLVECDPDNGQSFSITEFLCDHLPSDHDGALTGEKEIDDFVNAWIKANAPYSWVPRNRAVSEESLRMHLVFESNDEEDA